MAEMTTAPDPARWIEWVPLDDLVPAEVNPKEHDAALIAESVARHGYVAPIVRDERTGRIVAGHGRRLELLRARDAGEDPPDGVMVGEGGVWLVAVMCGWSSADDDQAAAYTIVDNVATEAGGWRRPELADMLGGLRDRDALLGTGYNRASVDELLAMERPPPPQLTDPDDLPPNPAPVTQLGDVWELGPHRVVCGDSTGPEVWSGLVGAADLVWTDPPYGVEIVGGSHAIPADVRRAAGGLTIENDGTDPAKLMGLLTASFSAAAKACRPGAVWFTTAPPGPLFVVFAEVLGTLGIWRQTLVWLKERFVMGRSDYHYRHESIFYGWVPGAAHQTPPDRTVDTVWECPAPARSPEHPTMKPVALIARAIEAHTNPGDLVLDPFAGSGSTLVAAHDTGRVAHVVELDPKYVDVICDRYRRHTGTMPTLAGTGEPFQPE